MKHHDIQLTGSVAVTGSFTIPVGTTDERPTDAKSGSIRVNTTLGGVVEVYTGASGSEWVTVGEQTAEVPGVELEYLVIAGGGGGGTGGAGCGGGGAGGYLSSSLSSMASGSSITVTVGSGGTKATTGNTAASTDGGDSSIASAGGTSFTTVTATGGGYGGALDSTRVASDGGSGGGDDYDNRPANSPGGSGTVGQGNDGGSSATVTSPYYGCGGGGAGGTGESNATGDDQSKGGEGLSSSITGTSTTRASGGSGGSRSSSIVSARTGGGGTGGSSGAAGGNGTVNTGGGGGGGSNLQNAGTGGSGVVILAYPSASYNGAGGIVGDAGNGRKYHQFNSTGTFELGTQTDFQLPNSSNLQLLWDPGHFDSRGSSTLTDLSGNSRNGSVSGATLGQDFYYSFDGSNDVITDSDYYRPNGAQTLIQWMYFAGDGSNGYALSGWQESNSYCYIGRRNSNDNLYFYIGQNSGGDTGTVLSDNTWYMCTITINSSGNYKIYSNTTQASSGNGVGLGNTGTVAFKMGAVGSTSNHFVNGRIGLVAFYDTDFSAADVTTFYNATKRNFT